MNSMQQPKFRHYNVIVTCLIVIGLLLTACGASDEVKVYRVGLLSGVGAFNVTFDGFKTKMTELGYKEGENITYDFQAANGETEKMSQLAEKFVADEVDLILTTTTGAANAARTATTSSDIPVLFTIVTNAVGSGVVDNLRQPGGNLTGITRPAPAYLGKRVEILQQMAPAVKRLWIFYDPDYPTASGSLPVVRQAASALGIELVETPVKSPEELVSELEKHSAADTLGVDAIQMMPDPINSGKVQDVLIFAREHNLPVVGHTSSQANQGALFSYADKSFEAGQMVAVLANKIFQGSKPGELPVETADLYLIINLKTAEAIGLDISDDVLETADEIIRE